MRGSQRAGLCGGIHHIHSVSAVRPLVSTGSQDTQGEVSVFMELYTQ